MSHAAQEPPAKVKQAVFLYLNTLIITSATIGEIRRSLFMPFECEYNAWVRDITAELEHESTHGGVTDADLPSARQ